MAFTPKPNKKFFLFFILIFFMLFIFNAVPVKANNTAGSIPFSQDWSNTTLVTVDNDWSNVTAIIGYSGNNFVAVVDTDPQTILADDSTPVVNVIANRSLTGLTTGGVAEFDGITDPVAALQGSGAAKAPYIKIFLDTTGVNQVKLSYAVRDIDGTTTDNSVQQVALHYRVGSSGSFTNLPAGYIADATTGPNLATMVTNVNVTLPAATENQPVIELRIMTTNATGFDEWVGIDNIIITANYAPTAITISPDTVLENQLSGTTVGALTASDANLTDTHIFALVSSASCTGSGADNVYFSLTGSTLKTTAAFDYEIKNSYSICIEATDNYGLSKIIMRTINISDVADETPPTVSIEQAALQTDPANTAPINFNVEFFEPVIGFASDDLNFSTSTAGGALVAVITEISPNNGTTYNVAVSGMTSNGLVIANITAGAAKDGAGNESSASSSVDNEVLFSTDITPPAVLSSNPVNGSVLLIGPTQIIIRFGEDLKSDASTGAANNAANFLLVEAGADLTFETISCLTGAAVTDVVIAVNTAGYQNKIVTLDINGGAPLSAGLYRLFVCGTTSIEDLIGNKLNDGLSDARINFTVSQILSNSGSNLPATGFPRGDVTHLPIQPADKTYASFSNLRLEIPALKVSTPIVGVPLSQNGWDVTWLGKNAGWLNQTAFPTWAGNSVITAHVWDSYNQPGTFYKLKDLQYGDIIKIHAFGQIYTYEVRETKQIAPDNFSAALRHEDKAWLTLITCEDYKTLFQTYSYRRVVRAVWVSVASEK